MSALAEHFVDLKKFRDHQDHAAFEALAVSIIRSHLDELIALEAAMPNHADPSAVKSVEDYLRQELASVRKLLTDAKRNSLGPRIG